MAETGAGSAELVDSSTVVAQKSFGVAGRSEDGQGATVRALGAHVLLSLFLVARLSVVPALGVLT